MKKYQVRDGYGDFFLAVCAWNHKKNLQTFKDIYKHCSEVKRLTYRPLWRLYIIFKHTWIDHRYKKIEEDFELVLDKI